MNAPARSIGWAFSLGAHALLMGGLLLLARDVVYVEPQNCRVSLAAEVPLAGKPEARQPAEGQSVTPPPPEREQAQKPCPKQPVPVATRPEPKKISPHKREAADMPRLPPSVVPPAPKALPATQPPPVSAAGVQGETAGSTGPQSRQLGDMRAYEYSALDQRPSITRRAEPEYPAKARRMSMQGSVVVQLVVDVTGQPRNCTVVRATPDGFFEEAALAAAKQMRFAPGKIKGQAVNTVVQLPFSFKLQ